MLLRTGLVCIGTALGALTLIAATSFQSPPATPAKTIPAPAAQATATAGEFTVDAVHSSLMFRVKHMGTSWFYGRVNDVTGKIVFDETNPTSSSIEIEAKMDTLDTHNEKRDGHLKSPDFFNVEKFATAKFKSKSCSKPVDGKFDVAGDLTLHGVTKPLTIKMEKSGSGRGQGGETIGFESTFDIKRSDFGMTYMPDGIGDEVRILVSLEAGKRGGGKDKPK
jgi:polyisoprenoid-binding protein YceI